MQKMHSVLGLVLPWDQGEHDSYGVVENRNSDPVDISYYIFAPVWQAAGNSLRSHLCRNRGESW